MKRPSDRKPRPSIPLPDELHPIVDSVVDVVFERLRGAAKARKGDAKEPQRGAPPRLNLPLPKQRKALAEALADLLLADLARRTAKKRAAKTVKKSAKRPSNKKSAQAVSARGRGKAPKGKTAPPEPKAPKKWAPRSKRRVGRPASVKSRR